MGYRFSPAFVINGVMSNQFIRRLSWCSVLLVGLLLFSNVSVGSKVKKPLLQFSMTKFAGAMVVCSVLLAGGRSAYQNQPIEIFDASFKRGDTFIFRFDGFTDSLKTKDPGAYSYRLVIDYVYAEVGSNLVDREIEIFRSENLTPILDGEGLKVAAQLRIPVSLHRLAPLRDGLKPKAAPLSWGGVYENREGLRTRIIRKSKDDQVNTTVYQSHQWFPRRRLLEEGLVNNEKLNSRNYKREESGSSFTVKMNMGLHFVPY